MEEGIEKIEGNEKVGRQEIHSKAVRAGKRTYFFDVKATKRNDYYLTITESKKRFNKDGRFFFEKHKIFLYKEDFEKFVDNLNEVIEYIKTSAPEMDEIAEETFETTEITSTEIENEDKQETVEDFTNVEFEDLDDK